MTCTSDDLHHVYFDGDTLINGENYKKVISCVYSKRYPSSYLTSQDYYNYKICVSNGQCQPIDENAYDIIAPQLLTVLRESNDSVIIITNDDLYSLGKEKLLMYYNVSKGDSYSTDFIDNLTVDSVAVKFIGGRNREVIYIQ
tara:strand:- start:472 stop:897 length:426 start_codon:yes stop_codon:yes gene_type:complete